MSDYSRDEPDAADASDVFDDVTPDPDAVLDAFDVDSPDDLLADAAIGDGAHDPTTDDAIDADDTIASELFDELGRVARELEATDTVEREPEGALTAGSTTETTERTQLGYEEADGVGETTVEKRVRELPSSWQAVFGRESDRSDGRTERRQRRTGRLLRVRTESDITLSGPTPSPVRISNETFGRV
ncbi:hypothetical protein [Natronosalvus caseinilyticus]|uniref:hypothetical protein n=1 Tax=Natronosalvus caseinilyticus TaxID=2953747 RepID=UPI0028ACA553|nr:hypothetical protein [Natronosalvus caseinilyticus]